MPEKFGRHCVYTIRHTDKLREVYSTGGAGNFETDQSWAQGKRILDEARRDGLLVPVLFAPAESTRRLFAWALIEEITLSDEKPRTRYRFSGLRLLPEGKGPLKTTLRKVSDGTALAAGFIRPYSICLTPKWVTASYETGTATPGTDPDLDDVDLLEAFEGRLLLRRHLVAERNRGLIDKKRAAVQREHGRLACEVCAFDFLAAYGDRGREFCEVHHRVPFSVQAGKRSTKLADLAILCSNCHRMMHRNPSPTVAELREVVFVQKQRQ